LTEPEATTVLINFAGANAQAFIPADIQSGLAGTRELAVLYSLAYNGPVLVGTNIHLAWAIRHDDRAEAWYEIRYGSNGGDPAFQQGLAKRHYAESQVFGLEDEHGQPSEAEARQVFRMFTHHEQDILDYDADFGAQVGNANTDYGLAGTPDEVETREVAFLPSFVLLVGAYGLGTSVENVLIDFIPDPANHPNDSTNLIDRTEHPQANDLIFGETGDDKILAAAGHDVVYADFGDSTLDANFGGGDDTLDGGAGNDTLDGGQGLDELTGGAGNDVFIVGTSAMDETIPYTDTIMDAEAGDRARFGDITPTGGTLDGYYFQPDEFEGGEWVPIESDEGYAYYNADDHIYYVKQDGDLVIALYDEDEQFVDSVLVKDWTDGDLGIQLTLVDNRPNGGGNSPLLFDGGGGEIDSAGGIEGGPALGLWAADVLPRIDGITEDTTAAPRDRRREPGGQSPGLC
jgi:hypothetical protein